MQDKTDQELLQEFLAPSSSQPGLVVTDFDAPIPDAVNQPFPSQLNVNWRGRDEDSLSDYSNMSQQPFDNFLQTNTYQSATTPFLSVPGALQRGRSPSIASNNSYSSVGLDSLEINSDWGEIQPFPGAQIVNVPPNWIGTINSPTNSVLSDCPSPLLAFGQERSLDTLFEPQPEQFLDFNEFLQRQNAGYAHSDIAQDQPQLQMKQAPSSESLFTLNNNQSNTPTEIGKKEEDPYRPTTVPDGRFWKVVKNNGQTLYQCPYPNCEKTFTRPYNLKSHYRSHTGERPYVCTDVGCEASFSRKHDLKRHMKLHSGERGFTCKACGKSFSRNDALGRHLKPSDNGKESICAMRMALAEREKRLQVLENSTGQAL